MFQIDVPTAMIVLIIGQFFTGVIGLAYRIRTEEDSFIQSFLLSRLFEMIAWIMMALRGLDLVPEYLSSLVANSLLIVSASLQVGALLKIKGKYQDRIKRIYRLINIAAPIIMLLLILLRTTEEVRVFVLSAGGKGAVRPGISGTGGVADLHGDFAVFKNRKIKGGRPCPSFWERTGKNANKPVISGKTKQEGSLNV